MIAHTTRGKHAIAEAIREKDVDGFSLLTKSNISDIIPRIGCRKKLLSRLNKIQESYDELCDNGTLMLVCHSVGSIAF